MLEIHLLGCRTSTLRAYGSMGRLRLTETTAEFQSPTVTAGVGRGTRARLRISWIPMASAVKTGEVPKQLLLER